jgi:hypothetical protein
MITYEHDEHGLLSAHGEVAVGVDRRTLRVPVGTWPDTEDPDPGGLHRVPVVVLPAPSYADVARAGALTAGGMPALLLLPADAPELGRQLLVAVREGVDVILLLGGGPAELTLARVLGGRPLPALALDDPLVLDATFAGLEVDVNVAVPSMDGTARGTIRRILTPLGLETVHHLVEVDPRPAYDSGDVPLGTDLNALGAAAAGVLAGRLAAGNRRWREQGR